MVSTICRWSSSDIEREKFFPPGLANKRGWTGGGCRNREQRDEKKGVSSSGVEKWKRKKKKKDQGATTPSGSSSRGGFVRRVLSGRGDFFHGGCDGFGYATMSVMNHAYAAKVRAW